jgi:tetratricopeptide (TPR) repeat protein
MENDSCNLANELEQIKAIAKSGNRNEAIALIDELARVHPREDAIWAARAFVNDREGEWAAAIVDWSKAIDICKEPHYYYMRGICLFQTKDYRNAICDFTKLIELCHVYKSDYYRESAYLFRADAHIRLGEFADARSDCLQVRNDMRTWTDKIRTRADILAECEP